MRVHLDENFQYVDGNSWWVYELDQDEELLRFYSIVDVNGREEEVTATLTFEELRKLNETLSSSKR